MTLPTTGGSAGTWGDEVNAHINVEHDSDGTHGDITPTSLTVTGTVTLTTANITTLTAVNYNIVSYENKSVFYENNIVTV